MKAFENLVKSWINLASNIENHKRAYFSKNVGNAQPKTGLVAPFNSIIDLNIIKCTRRSSMASKGYSVRDNLKLSSNVMDMMNSKNEPESIGRPLTVVVLWVSICLVWEALSSLW